MRDASWLVDRLVTVRIGASALVRNHALRIAGVMLIAGISPAAAQDAPICEALLDEAEERYVGLAFDEAESLVRSCLADPEVSDDDAVQGYRLLALLYLQQDRLQEARQAVLGLLGVSFAYEPDQVLDPPGYVAFVNVIKDQITIDADLPFTAEQAPPEPRGGVSRWLVIGGSAAVASLVGVLLLVGGSSTAPPAGSPLPPPPSFPR